MPKIYRMGTGNSKELVARSVRSLKLMVQQSPSVPKDKWLSTGNYILEFKNGTKQRIAVETRLHKHKGYYRKTKARTTTLKKDMSSFTAELTISAY